MFLEDGTEVASSYEKLPLLFTVGRQTVLEGLEVGIRSVTVGGSAELTVPSLYAYAQEGCPPHIPPHSVVILKVELLEIRSV